MTTTINLTLQFGDKVNKPLDFPIVFECIKMYVGFRLKRNLSQKKFFDSYLSKFMIPLGYNFSNDFFESNDATNGSWEYQTVTIGGGVGEQSPHVACLTKRRTSNGDYINILNNEWESNTPIAWHNFWNYYWYNREFSDDNQYNFNHSAVYPLYSLANKYHFLGKHYNGGIEQKKAELLYPNSAMWSYPGLMYYPHLFITGYGTENEPYKLQCIKEWDNTDNFREINTTTFNDTIILHYDYNLVNKMFRYPSSAGSKSLCRSTNDSHTLYNDTWFTRDGLLNVEESELEFIDLVGNSEVLNTYDPSDILECDTEYVNNQTIYKYKFDLFFEIRLNNHTYWLNSANMGDGSPLIWTDGQIHNKTITIPKEMSYNTTIQASYDNPDSILVNNEMFIDDDVNSIINKHFYRRIGNTDYYNNGYPSLVKETDSVDSSKLNGKYEIYNYELFQYFISVNQMQSMPSWLKWSATAVPQSTNSLTQVIKDNEWLGNKSVSRSSLLTPMIVSGNKTLVDYNLDEIYYNGNNVIEEMYELDGNILYKNDEMMLVSYFSDNTLYYTITELPESASSIYEISYHILKQTLEIKVYDSIKKSMVKFEYTKTDSPITILKDSEKLVIKFNNLSWTILLSGMLRITLKSKNGIEIPIYNILKQNMFKRMAVEKANQITVMQYGPYEKWMNNEFIIHSKNVITSIQTEEIENYLYYAINTPDSLCMIVTINDKLSIGQYDFTMYDRENKILFSKELWVVPSGR